MSNTMVMSVNEIGNCGQCLKKEAKYLVEVIGFLWLWRKRRILCEDCCQQWKRHYKYDVE